MAELRGVWEMPPRGGLHRVGLSVVIPAPSLGGLGRICAGGSEVMPRLGGEREVLMVALRLVWHLWASVPLPWLASAAGLSSFGGVFWPCIAGSHGQGKWCSWCLFSS